MQRAARGRCALRAAAASHAILRTAVPSSSITARVLAGAVANGSPISATSPRADDGAAKAERPIARAARPSSERRKRTPCWHATGTEGAAVRVRPTAPPPPTANPTSACPDRPNGSLRRRIVSVRAGQRPHPNIKPSSAGPPTSPGNPRPTQQAWPPGLRPRQPAVNTSLSSCTDKGPPPPASATWAARRSWPGALAGSRVRGAQNPGRSRSCPVRRGPRARPRRRKSAGSRS